MLLTIVPAEEPSTRFNSAAVDVTPVRIFISAALAVTPSNMFNSAPVDVTVVPASFKAAIAVVPARLASVNKSYTIASPPPPSVAIILTSPAATATLAPDP